MEIPMHMLTETAPRHDKPSVISVDNNVATPNRWLIQAAASHPIFIKENTNEFVIPENKSTNDENKPLKNNITDKLDINNNDQNKSKEFVSKIPKPNGKSIKRSSVSTSELVTSVQTQLVELNNILSSTNYNDLKYILTQFDDIKSNIQQPSMSNNNINNDKDFDDLKKQIESDNPMEFNQNKYTSEVYEPVDIQEEEIATNNISHINDIISDIDKIIETSTKETTETFSIEDDKADTNSIEAFSFIDSTTVNEEVPTFHRSNTSNHNNHYISESNRSSAFNEMNLEERKNNESNYKPSRRKSSKSSKPFKYLWKEYTDSTTGT